MADWSTWIGVLGVSYAPDDATKGPLLNPGITERPILDLDDDDWFGPAPVTPTTGEVAGRGTRSPWGITAAGIPYYDTAGATPGEEARVIQIAGVFYLDSL